MSSRFHRAPRRLFAARFCLTEPRTSVRAASPAGHAPISIQHRSSIDPASIQHRRLQLAVSPRIKLRFASFHPSAARVSGLRGSVGQSPRPLDTLRALLVGVGIASQRLSGLCGRLSAWLRSTLDWAGACTGKYDRTPSRGSHGLPAGETFSEASSTINRPLRRLRANPRLSLRAAGRRRCPAGNACLRWFDKPDPDEDRESKVCLGGFPT